MVHDTLELVHTLYLWNVRLCSKANGRDEPPRPCPAAIGTLDRPLVDPIIEPGRLDVFVVFGMFRETHFGIDMVEVSTELVSVRVSLVE